MSSPVSPPLTVSTVDGATVGRPITTLKVSNGTLTVTGNTAIITTGGGGGGSGTVTSIATTAPLTGGTITTTGTIGIPVATGAADGYLSSANFNTFDAKQDAITLTTTGTSGAATFSGGTLNIPQYSGTTGTVTGTGAANQVSYWTAASVQAGSTGLTYNPSTGDLTVGGYVEVGTKVTTPTGTDLILDTVGGTNSGSIVIADGVDGQISITPNGSGKIKLDGVELDNSAIATGYVLKATSASAAGWAAESGGGGGIGGSITDNQVAVGATTADEIEGSVGFTYDSSTKSLNIAAGAGTGTILSGSSDMVIRNSGATPHSKITLGYDAANSNIKLDTDGSGLVEIHKEGSLAYSLPNVVTTTNDYVLTAQTDGSTAWAASGGGGGGAVLPATILDGGTLDLFLVSKMGLWGSRSTSASTYNGTATPHFFPFINPKAGDINHISINVNSDGTGVYGFAIYRDSNGAPVTKLGGDMTYTGGTGGTGRQDLTPSSTVTLEANTQYWLGVVETSTGNTSLTSESGNDVCSAHPISSSTSNLAAIATLASLTLSSSSNTLPTSITVSNLSGDFTPQIRWGIVYQ